MGIFSSIDRFSSLPDHVAHNVLCFLSMEDISRLCVVSKRSRQLCISIPILNFDVLKYKHHTTKRRQLLNYLERFLVLRRGMETQRCYIRWSSVNKFLDEEYRVYSWLYNALISNVELLDIYVELLEEGEFTLPSSVLFCKSLKFLTLSSRSFYLEFPSSITSVRFSFLQSLSLICVEISESFGEWVSSYCKFLENLILKFTSGTKSIVIKSSSLKYLKISFPHGLFHIDVSAELLQDIKLLCCFDSPDNSSLQLSTPSVTKFCWCGEVLNFCFRESFRPMFASLILSISSRRPLKASTFTTRCLDGVLHALCNTKVLTMGEMSVLHGCLPTLFINLSSLYLWTGHTSISNKLVLALTSLLVGIPNLFYLYIGRNKDANNTKAVVYFVIFFPMNALLYVVYDEIKGCREVQNSVLMPNLKWVTINFVVIRENELKVIKYLLKHAKGLQKMTISNASNDDIKEIKEYENASGVELIFRIRE
ncbi:hypothetical protein UlMin_005173 [Ulmus minor]